VSPFPDRACFVGGAESLLGVALEKALVGRCKWPLEKFFFKARFIVPRGITMAEELRFT
jgi:hypothetical protein